MGIYLSFSCIFCLLFCSIIDATGRTARVYRSIWWAMSFRVVLSRTLNCFFSAHSPLPLMTTFNVKTTSPWRSISVYSLIFFNKFFKGYCSVLENSDSLIGSFLTILRSTFSNSASSSVDEVTKFKGMLLLILTFVKQSDNFLPLLKALYCSSIVANSSFVSCLLNLYYLPPILILPVSKLRPYMTRLSPKKAWWSGICTL